VNSYTAPHGSEAAIQIPRRRPAVVGLMKKVDEGTPERSHSASSPQLMNTYEKEYNMRFMSEAERSPRMSMAAPELYSTCGYRSGSLPFTTQQQPKLQKQHSSQQMSYSVPSQTLRVNGYPVTDTRKRCNSFSAQSMLPNAADGAYFHRQSYPSVQADRRSAEVESQDHSQYMIEAQNQMRAQLIFQQQRMQDQHLQQQQLQQLHRLHTQQLKQAKQKSFEVKAQPERSVAQHRMIADGPIYQVIAPPHKCGVFRSDFTKSLSLSAQIICLLHAHSTLLSQVQFKCSHRYMILGENFPQGVKVGSFVVVEADRGEDLGVVVLIAPRDSPLAISLNTANSTASKGSEGELKKILRFATPQERSELPNKAKDEMEILKVRNSNSLRITVILSLHSRTHITFYRQICREWAPEKYNLSIYLVDAEYQFDRHKLVLYYSAARYASVKTTVTMSHIVHCYRSTNTYSSYLVLSTQAH
jgi:cell fate regulator YaaT (PSP1 superfamily)